MSHGFTVSHLDLARNGRSDESGAAFLDECDCAYAIGVYPFTEVAELLLAGLGTVQDLKSSPLLRLGLADEGEDRLGKDRTFTVEALLGNGNVYVLE